MENLEQMSLSKQVQRLGKIISRERYVKRYSQNSWTTGEGGDGHSSKAETITEYTPVYASRYNFNKKIRKDAENKLKIIKEFSIDSEIKSEVNAQFANAKKMQDKYVINVIGKSMAGVFMGGFITGMIAGYGYLAWKLYEFIQETKF